MKETVEQRADRIVETKPFTESYIKARAHLIESIKSLRGDIAKINSRLKQRLMVKPK